VPIPDITDKGHLPPGIHACTVSELARRFGTASTQRKRLMKCLIGYLARLRDLGGVGGVLIDGSFTSDRPQPHDVDVVVPMPAPPDRRWLEGFARLMRESKDRYHVHTLPDSPGAPGTWADFLQRVKPIDQQMLGITDPNYRKGLLWLPLERNA